MTTSENRIHFTILVKDLLQYYRGVSSLDSPTGNWIVMQNFEQHYQPFINKINDNALKGDTFLPGIII